MNVCPRESSLHQFVRGVKLKQVIDRSYYVEQQYVHSGICMSHYDVEGVLLERRFRYKIIHLLRIP